MRNKVKVGAKMKKTDAPDFILEIMEFKTPEGNLPHARTRVSVSRFDLGVRLDPDQCITLMSTYLFIGAVFPDQVHVADFSIS